MIPLARVLAIIRISASTLSPHLQPQWGATEAAAAVGISRSLAAYYLDKLAGYGLLEVSYGRPDGR